VGLSTERHLGIAAHSGVFAAAGLKVKRIARHHVILVADGDADRDNVRFTPESDMIGGLRARVFSAAVAILDEKKQPVLAKFGPPHAAPFAASAFGRGAAKQSVNHAGKETNALRRALTSTSLSFLGGAPRAIAAQARSRSSQQRSIPARSISASR
jgi:hypothetical protein